MIRQHRRFHFRYYHQHQHFFSLGCLMWSYGGGWKYGKQNGIIFAVNEMKMVKQKKIIQCDLNESIDRSINRIFKQLIWLISEIIFASFNIFANDILLRLFFPFIKLTDVAQQKKMTTQSTKKI